jgi:hypothetical protein
VATAFQTRPTPLPLHSASRVALILVATVGAVAVLAVAGITFVALAVAFPIAVQAVDGGFAARASDIEFARQAAGFWWLFLAAGVASFAAALATVVEVIRRVSPTASE